MRFIIFFLIYLFIEINTTLWFGSYVGGFLTFLEVIVSAGIAVFIFVNFKHSLYDTLVSFAKKKVSKEKAIAFNIGSLIGGILLFLPGLFSDAIGILLQFSFFYLILEKIFNIRYLNQNQTRNFKNEEIINTELIVDDHGSDVFVTKQDRK